MAVYVTRRKPPQQQKAKQPHPPRLWPWQWAIRVTLAGAWAITARIAWTNPSASWLGYTLAVLATLTFAAGWFERAKQRRSPFGDKAVAWWLWHWFTGTPLVWVPDPDRSLWANLVSHARHGFLDTSRAAPAPPKVTAGDQNHDGDDDEHDAALRLERRRDRRRWVAARAGRGLGRTGITVTLILSEYLRSGAPQGYGLRTVATWGLGGSLALALFVLAVAAVTMQGAMWRWWFRPLHIALVCGKGEGLVDHPDEKRPRSWIDLYRSWLRHETGITLRLPLSQKLSKDRRDKVEETTLQVLGLDAEDVAAKWNPVGEHRQLRLTVAPRIPDRVSMVEHADARRWFFETSTATAPVLGATKGWAPVTQDIYSDSPHICIGGPTGTGKSTLVRLILGELVHQNVKAKLSPTVEVWDYKQISQMEFEGLPGVTYARTLDAIADRMEAVLDIANDRMAQAVKHKQRTGRLPRFDPLFVVFEDVNSPVKFLRQHRPAALAAWEAITNLGRAANIHVIALPQQPRADALGNGAVRLNFGIVILMAGYDQNTWRMVCNAWPFQPLLRSKKHPGRCMVITDAGPVVCQPILTDEAEIGQLMEQALGERVFQVPESDEVRRHAARQQSEGPQSGDDPEGHHDHGDRSPADGPVEGNGHRHESSQQQANGNGHERHQNGDGLNGHGSGSRIQRPHDLGVGGDPGVHVVDGEPIVVNGSGPAGVPELEEPGLSGGVGGGGHAPIIRPDQPVRLPLFTNNDQAPYSNGDGAGTGVIGVDATTGDSAAAPAPLRPGPASPSAGQPVNGTRYATSPEDAGVMASEPSRTRPDTTAPAPPNYSPSTPRACEGRYPVPVWGSQGADVSEVGGEVTPGSVTLREWYASRRPPLTWKSLVQARRRDLQARAKGNLARWFPDPPVQRGKRDDGLEDRHMPGELDQWWRERPRSDSNRPGFERWEVYWIVRGGQVREDEVVKVGFTSNLEGKDGRLDHFGDVVEDVLRRIDSWPDGTPLTEGDARRIERHYHRRWKRYWREREQFYMRGDLLAFMQHPTPDHYELQEITDV
jgi:hypothetical protein